MYRYNGRHEPYPKKVCKKPAGKKEFNQVLQCLLVHRDVVANRSVRASSRFHADDPVRLLAQEAPELELVDDAFEARQVLPEVLERRRILGRRQRDDLFQRDKIAFQADERLDDRLVRFELPDGLPAAQIVLPEIFPGYLLFEGGDA